MIDWWESAWLSDSALRARFEREVVAALPVQNPVNLIEVIEGVAWRRLRLRQDQQLSEWAL
jgi:hypothetical protein